MSWEDEAAEAAHTEWFEQEMRDKMNRLTAELEAIAAHPSPETPEQAFEFAGWAIQRARLALAAE